MCDDFENSDFLELDKAHSVTFIEVKKVNRELYGLRLIEARLIEVFQKRLITAFVVRHPFYNCWETLLSKFLFHQEIMAQVI